MEPSDLPAWAAQQAAHLLAGLGDRWTHVQAVAAQARRVSAALAPQDRPYLIAAAWLHDIGYAPPLNRLVFHPVDGARYVRQQGQERLASLVAYHSGARFEAEERGLVDALAEFEPEDGPLLDALTYADMATGPTGRRVDLEERIAEILQRYPPDDPVHRAVSRSHPVLREAVDRTRARLVSSARI
jgi:HD domain-containing protein